MIETRPTGSTLVARAAVAFEDFRDGDRAAFDDLIRMTTPLLWHTARSQGLDTAAAEDVLQTIWMRLIERSGTVNDPRAVVKWLLVSTRREAWRVSGVARRARAYATDDEDTAPMTPEHPAPVEEQPEQRVVHDDDQRRLWGHIQTLPPRCRELIRVIAFADRPDYAEIAEALGMPIGSIGPTRGRCLAKLRAALQGDPRWAA